MVEVTLEKVYYSKLKFTIVNGAVSVTGIFQFTMVNSTLVNFHDYRGKNKDDPSPITIWLPKKIGGYGTGRVQGQMCMDRCLTCHR